MAIACRIAAKRRSQRARRRRLCGHRSLPRRRPDAWVRPPVEVARNRYNGQHTNRLPLPTSTRSTSMKAHDKESPGAVSYQCPICGNSVPHEPSLPRFDAPCSECGYHLWCRRRVPSGDTELEVLPLRTPEPWEVDQLAKCSRAEPCPCACCCRFSPIGSGRQSFRCQTPVPEQARPRLRRTTRFAWALSECPGDVCTYGSTKLSRSSRAKNRLPCEVKQGSGPTWSRPQAATPWPTAPDLPANSSPGEPGTASAAAAPAGSRPKSEPVLKAPRHASVTALKHGMRSTCQSGGSRGIVVQGWSRPTIATRANLVDTRIWSPSTRHG